MDSRYNIAIYVGIGLALAGIIWVLFFKNKKESFTPVSEREKTLYNAIRLLVNEQLLNVAIKNNKVLPKYYEKEFKELVNTPSLIKFMVSAVQPQVNQFLKAVGDKPVNLKSEYEIIKNQINKKKI